MAKLKENWCEVLLVNREQVKMIRIKPIKTILYFAAAIQCHQHLSNIAILTVP